MASSMLVTLLLLIVLEYMTLANGQTTSRPRIMIPICDFINRTRFEKSVGANKEDVEDPPPVGAGLYFTLDSTRDNKTNRHTVTLGAVNMGQDTRIKTVVIYINNFNTNREEGFWWNDSDNGGPTSCSNENSVYYNNGESRTEYTAIWQSGDVSNTPRIEFRATVWIHDKSTNHDSYYFGIGGKSKDTSNKGSTSGLKGLPIAIIIYCAVAFLIVALVFSLVLCCYCRRTIKRTRRTREDITPLAEAAPVNTPTCGRDQTVREGAKNAEVGVHEDKVGELPQIKRTQKQPSARFSLSDAVEKEILKDGGSLGHKVGKTEIARSHVIMKEMVGEGAFGDVYKAQAIGITNEPWTTVAVKILKDSSLADEDFKKELKILMTFEPHPNIVQLMGACTEKEPYFLVLEFADVGDLRAFLHKKRSATGKRKLDPKQIITFAMQIATGMEYIESKQCVHRDLASRNILLSNINNELICKLSDFGLARTVNNKEEYRMQSDSRVPVRWMAPECIRDNLYTTKSDVWSFGVVCWELVTMGSHPYGGYKASQVIKMVIHGTRLEKPDNCSKELYDVIMTSCWQEKSSRRPGFSNLRQQLQVMLGHAEDYISPPKLDVKGYVYLKPANWDNSDGDDKPRRKAPRRKSIPNNYQLQFEGRKRGK